MTDTVRKALAAVAIAITAATLAPAQAAVVRLNVGAHGHGQGHGHGHEHPAGRPVPQGLAGGLRGTVDFNANEEAQGWTDILDGSFITYRVERGGRPHGGPPAHSAAYRVVSAAS
jgi:hypothetical protein